MLRVVGDAADKVSSLRLVELLPKSFVGAVMVSSDSFGRFEGDGPASLDKAGADARLCVMGPVGCMASDMMLETMCADE